MAILSKMGNNPPEPSQVTTEMLPCLARYGWYNDNIYMITSAYGKNWCVVVYRDPKDISRSVGKMWEINTLDGFMSFSGEIVVSSS